MLKLSKIVKMGVAVKKKEKKKTKKCKDASQKVSTRYEPSGYLTLGEKGKKGSLVSGGEGTKLMGLWKFVVERAETGEKPPWRETDDWKLL